MHRVEGACSHVAAPSWPGPRPVAWTGQNMTLPLPTDLPKLSRVATARAPAASRTGAGGHRIRLIAKLAEPFINQSFTPDGWGRGAEV
jgi:hypothetical protein